MRIVVCLLLLLLLEPSVAGAQLRLPKDTLDWPTPSNVLAFNPAGIGVDYLSLAFVHALDERHAIGAFGAFIYRPLGGYLPRGYAGGLIYRHYPGAQALWRFHYAAQLSYQYAWLTGSPEISGHGIGLGLSVGWQWFPVRGFAVGFSVGEQFIEPLEPIGHRALGRVFGWRPILSFDLGVAW